MGKTRSAEPRSLDDKDVPVLAFGDSSFIYWELFLRFKRPRTERIEAEEFADGEN